MSCLKNKQLLKKEAKVLADKLADSVFTTLADTLADGWRIESKKPENPITMRVYRGFLLADRLADVWRGIIRQSATHLRVADVWRMLGLADTFCG
jgi:hypothetical protein